MGRAPCCDKVGLKKGPWTPEEDQILINFIANHGHSNWRALPKQSGLLRCGKSCRLRWINYLRPDIKRGNFTREEEDTIIHLHEVMGNRWSAIAAKLPGRTDNEIKNVWHTHLKKRLKEYQPTKSQPKNATTKKSSSNKSTSDSSTTSGNSFLETTTTSSVENQHVTSFGSPQQSTTTSSDEFSSGSTEVSSGVEFSNNNIGVTTDVQSFDYSSIIQEIDLEDFPIIDETFWEESSQDQFHLNDDQDHYSNMTTTSSSDLDYYYSNNNIIIDDNNGVQFESLLRDNQEIITQAMINNNEYNGNGPTSIFGGDDDDDNMDFWLDVFVQAGGAPELPEF